MLEFEKKFCQWLKNLFCLHPILCTYIYSPVLIAFLICVCLGGLWSWELIVIVPVLSIFIGLPVVLTVSNTVALFRLPREERWRRFALWRERVTVVLGALYSVLISSVNFGGIYFGADWNEVLVGNGIHAPIWTEAYPTLLPLIFTAFAGYLMLSGVRLDKLTPIAIVLSMSAMYVGVALCIVWAVQIVGKVSLEETALYLAAPYNCIVVALKTIRGKMTEWGERKGTFYSGKNGVLDWINRRLDRAVRWPVAALILMLPVLGLLVAVLTLFGQEPDAVIKAWTETSDWRLSQRVAPPNVYVDGHYLCTVAAGGHRRVVKPLREGERHGHRVVVNRQLCIANAFEQILEERVPRVHRRVRHFYDTYGFPVARLIRTRWAADVVYFLMKPLEWLFLLVIYACDVRPENRIAVQYLPMKG